jgi:deoxyribonuclease-4
MRLLGIHIRTASGLTAAARHARDIGCKSFQIMSGNPSAWNPGKLDAGAAHEFKDLVAEYNVGPVFLHAGYLINLSCRTGRNAPIYAKSIRLLKVSIERAVELGCAAVVFHLGSRKNTTPDEAQKSLVDGICRLETEVRGFPTGIDLPQLLLENSAGAGDLTGSRFEELGDLIAAVEARNCYLQLGVCLDTAHMWGAGYNLATPTAVRKVINDYDNIVGVDRLKLVHFNDSSVELGSHKDRHEHPGAGLIPVDGLRALARNRKIRHVPLIMETPGKTEPGDEQRMRDLKELAGAD